jgi:protein-L-isoaspartate(D-aspartate) O-methyltransferase
VNHSRQCLALLSYDNVQVHHADGYKGWPAAAPYAAIVLTAAAPSIPQNLLDQLAPDGRLVAPIGSTVGDQELLRVTLSDDGEMLSEPLAGVRFVPMVEGVRP